RKKKERRDKISEAGRGQRKGREAGRDGAAKVGTAARGDRLRPGGLATTSVKSGQQWDAANGWAPLQGVAAEGLQNYGQDDLAMEVSWRSLTNVQRPSYREHKQVEN
uniref:trehalase family glycosidase n=1 Tax=Salmonella enterica TaxID=28901 RepID=UPI00398C4924